MWRVLHDQPALAKAKAAERTQGELQEYLQTHFSRNTLAWGPVAVSRMRSYQGPSRQPQASLQAERARQTLGQRNKSQIVRASFHDDCAHVFGEKGHIAGIPTCSKCSAVGARLRYTLRNRPHEFVSLARQEMQEIIARPDSQPAARMVTSQELRRRREATEPSTTSHYASIRLRLEASLSRSVVSSLDADPDKPVRGVLPSEAKFQEVMDVLYFWALGEAYMLHPQLQSDMRQSLGRLGAGPMAAGEDALELRSRVQLLDGPFYEGSYLIGSVNFVGMSSSDDTTWGTWKEEGDNTDGIDEELPVPSLDAVWYSEAGRMIMATEGDSPTRMNRQSAAKTYAMYQLWGYCQRRLTSDREATKAASTADGDEQGAPPGKQAASRRVPRNSRWQFFDNLPNHSSRWRTNEAAAVAERHLRALFGEQDECITTLQAWQQMTHEAKWFGRALYDAEEFVLKTCLPSLEV